MPNPKPKIYTKRMSLALTRDQYIFARTNGGVEYLRSLIHHAMEADAHGPVDRKQILEAIKPDEKQRNLVFSGAALGTVVGTATAATAALSSTTGETVSNIKDKATEVASEAVDKIKSVGSDVVHSVEDKAEKVFSDVKDKAEVAVGGLWARFIAWFRGLIG